MFVFFVSMLLLAMVTDKSEHIILESMDEEAHTDLQIFSASEKLRNNSN